MDIYEKLREAGLTGNEAKVYLELSKKGQLTANNIAKNISMDRTLTYTVLNHLIEKGQVSYVIKEGKKYFSCSNPEALLNQIKSKEAIISDLIKELNEIKTEKSQDVEINVYEGKAGIRTFINLALKQKNFCAYGSTGKAYYQLYEMSVIAKQIGKRKIKVRIIGNKKLKGTEAFNFENIDYKYWDVDSESTTTIFGDYIAIQLIKDNPIVIIIKNKQIADSHRNYFEFMWKIAKK